MRYASIDSRASRRARHRSEERELVELRYYLLSVTSRPISRKSLFPPRDGRTVCAVGFKLLSLFLFERSKLAESILFMEQGLEVVRFFHCLYGE